MQEEIQKMLDEVQQHMKSAQQLTYSGPAGTRVLQSLVTVLSQQFLTVNQQQQVTSLLDLHDTCLSRNGKIKK